MASQPINTWRNCNSRFILGRIPFSNLERIICKLMLLLCICFACTQKQRLKPNVKSQVPIQEPVQEEDGQADFPDEIASTTPDLKQIDLIPLSVIKQFLAESCEQSDIRDRDRVRRVFHKKSHKWEFCFERILSDRPKIPSALVIQLIVSKKGKVQAVSTNIEDTRVAKCVEEEIEKIKFPRQSCKGILYTVSMDIMTPEG